MRAHLSGFDDWSENASVILTFLSWEIEGIVILVPGILNFKGEVGLRKGSLIKIWLDM